MRSSSIYLSNTFSKSKSVNCLQRKDFSYEFQNESYRNIRCCFHFSDSSYQYVALWARKKSIYRCYSCGNWCSHFLYILFLYISTRKKKKIVASTFFVFPMPVWRALLQSRPGTLDATSPGGGQFGDLNKEDYTH